jgi:hypothetical protein
VSDGPPLTRRTRGPGYRAALAHPFTVAGAAVVAVSYLAVVDPNQPGHYPSCPIRWLTGYWCPGCGGLRAVHDLAHGQIGSALSANLVVVIMVPVMVTLWARWVVTRSARGRAEPRTSRPGPPWLFWSLLVTVVIFWGLRNLPATAWLAP